MDRDTAQRKLAMYPNGTFLVRCRVNMSEPNFAISLKTSMSDVKHMKIVSNLNDDFYLSDNRKFKSIVELITYFSRNSLKESFGGLDCLLRFSIKELLIVEVMHRFDPEASSPDGNENNLLPLEIGDRLIVLDRYSGGHGWWKACDSNQRIGYIPKSYVNALE